MELRQLRYFLVVSEELHFGRAACRLNMTQPPLSVAIRELERELGAELFERSTRRIRLTDVGKVLADKVRDILGDVDDLPILTRDGYQGAIGSLTVGFVSSASLSVLPAALRLFRERHERVELKLNEVATAQQLDALYDETIDVGLVRSAAARVGLTVTPVLVERLVAVIPADHPLATYARVPVAKLGAEPLVSVPHRLMPDFYEASLKLFADVPTRPRIVQRAVHQETILGLVAAGVGLAVLPETVMRLQRHGVVYRPLEDEHTRIPLSIATSEHHRSTLVDHFVECVHRAAESEHGELQVDSAGADAEQR